LPVESDPIAALFSEELGVVIELEAVGAEQLDPVVLEEVVRG